MRSDPACGIGHYAAGIHLARATRTATGAPVADLLEGRAALEAAYRERADPRPSSSVCPPSSTAWCGRSGAIAQCRSLALLAVGGYGRGSVVPLLRCGRARPAAGRDERRDARERLRPGESALGCRPGVGSQRALHRRVHGEGAQDITVQTNLIEARWIVGSRICISASARRSSRRSIPRLLRSQGARAAAASQPLQRHCEQPRAQPQGKPGRSARSHQYPVDRHGHRDRPQLAGPCANTASSHRRKPTDRRAMSACCRTCASGCTTRPAAAKTAWCSTCRRRWRCRWACGHAGQARRRTAHAALLPHRARRHAAERNHPAEHAHHRVPGGRGPSRAARRALRGAP